MMVKFYLKVVKYINLEDNLKTNRAREAIPSARAIYNILGITPGTRD